MDTSILPAQSSSALPLPPQPRLDLLPTELLQEIIDDLAPIPRSSLEYDDRQRSLLSLCLTSKRLLSFAQPALFKAIMIIFPHRGARLLRRIDLLAHCQWFRVNLHPTDYVNVFEAEKNLAGIFEHFTKLRDYAYFGRKKQFVLHVMPNITRLHLSRVHLDSSYAFSSPCLKELSLYDVTSTQSALVPTNQGVFRDLPALRHLGIDGFFAGVLRGVTLDQLRTVSANCSEWRWVQDQAKKGRFGTASILYWSDLGRTDYFTEAARIEHLKLALPARCSVYGARADDVLRPLIQWQQLIANAQPPCPLTLLYLPFLHLTGIERLPSPIREVLERLIKTCERLQIEVVFEEPDYDHAYNSLISPEFVKRSEIMAVAARKKL